MKLASLMLLMAGETAGVSLEQKSSQQQMMESFQNELAEIYSDVD